MKVNLEMCLKIGQNEKSYIFQEIDIPEINFALSSDYFVNFQKPIALRI